MDVQRSTPQERYEQAKEKCEEATKDLAYWQGILRLLEETYPELTGTGSASAPPARRGRYREIFEGDRRIAIADALMRRGGKGRDIALVSDLEREDLVIPTKEKDPEKHRVAYLKRVRQSLSGNPTWFKYLGEGRAGGEEYYEYEVTSTARKKVAEHFKE